MHDDFIDSLRHYAFIQGRCCGKTALAKELDKQLARQLLNSKYGLASADNWAERYLYVTDKLYDTLGIKDYLNKVYGDPTLKFKNGNYIRWDDIDLTNKLKELFKAPDIVDLINQIEKEEEKSMRMENRTKLGEWIFGGDTFLTGHEAVFGTKIPATVYASKSGLRFAFHPVENSSHIVDVVFGDCDFSRCELRDGFFVKVHTDTRHKLTIYDNYPNNLALKKIREEYNEWFLADLNQPREKKDEVRYTAPCYAMPKIEKVIFNPPATIVKWKDGTKTVVKCQDDDKFDWEKGLAMAYVKRAFNNERTYYGLFKKNEPWMNLPNSNVKYDPNEVKKLELFVPKDIVITEKGLRDAVDALTKACDDKIDEMLGDVDISREMEFIETGKWPENRKDDEEGDK